MEERREDSNAEYTGEYGNAIQGDYQEDSTYRYAYSDRDETAHSGDYYASAEDNGPGAGSDENGAIGGSDDATAFGDKEEKAGSGLGDNGGQEWNGYGGSLQGRDDSGASQGNIFGGTSQGNAFGGDSLGNGYGGSPYGGNFSGNAYYGQSPKPPKASASFGKKMLATVACAVVFGLVAGIFFNGFNYFASRVERAATGTRELDNTTVTDQGDKKAGDEKEDQANPSDTADKKDVAAIAEQAMPAVVAITSTSQGADYYDLFGQRYQGREATSSGTGFIVGQNDKELLIATNNHVVDGAKTISVQFIDGEIYEAKEKGADSSNDLAVVAVTVSSVKKTTMEKIKIADLGNSDKAKVGEMVIAIGNALGYGQSVTVGYISAKDREITESDESGQSVGNKIKAIQTDAAINPGNSGGALINMQGQVIGINSAKIAASSVEGVGYAIPISVATPIIDELMNKEILNEDEKGYLGISGTEVTQQVTMYNMPYGVYVKEVAKGGAAEKGGIKAGDVITAVNKVEVTTMESLQEKVNSYRKGTKVEVTVQRSNNGEYKAKKLTVTLQGKESLDSLSDGSDTGSNDSAGGNNGSNGNDGSSGGNNGSNGDNGSNGGNNGSGGNEGIPGEDGTDDFGSFWDFFR